MSTTESSSHDPSVASEPIIQSTDRTYVELTPHALDPSVATKFVRSPSAGATVLFIGTTRDSFNDLSVRSLAYSAYAPLAIMTLQRIASEILAKHECSKIAIIHKLGECPVSEESIVIGVSSKHRQAAWRAGEEALEETKARAEIWKLERFQDGEGVWRANRDGVMGIKIVD